MHAILCPRLCVVAEPRAAMPRVRVHAINRSEEIVFDPSSRIDYNRLIVNNPNLKFQIEISDFSAISEMRCTIIVEDKIGFKMWHNSVLLHSALLYHFMLECVFLIT